MCLACPCGHRTSPLPHQPQALPVRSGLGAIHSPQRRLRWRAEHIIDRRLFTSQIGREQSSALPDPGFGRGHSVCQARAAHRGIALHMARHLSPTKRPYNASEFFKAALHSTLKECHLPKNLRDSTSPRRLCSLNAHFCLCERCPSRREQLEAIHPHGPARTSRHRHHPRHAEGRSPDPEADQDPQTLLYFRKRNQHCGSACPVPA